jgi:hypothetical protein
MGVKRVQLSLAVFEIVAKREVNRLIPIRRLWLTGAYCSDPFVATSGHGDDVVM